MVATTVAITTMPRQIGMVKRVAQKRVARKYENSHANEIPYTGNVRNHWQQQNHHKHIDDKTQNGAERTSFNILVGMFRLSHTSPRGKQENLRPKQATVLLTPHIA